MSDRVPNWAVTARQSHAWYLAQQKRRQRRRRLVPILAWSFGTVAVVFVFSLGFLIGRLS